MFRKFDDLLLIDLYEDIWQKYSRTNITNWPTIVSNLLSRSDILNDLKFDTRSTYFIKGRIIHTILGNEKSPTIFFNLYDFRQSPLSWFQMYKVYRMNGDDSIHVSKDQEFIFDILEEMGYEES